LGQYEASINPLAAVVDVDFIDVVVAPPPDDDDVVGVEELLPLLHAAKRTAEKATAPIPRKDLRTELIETPFVL